MEYFLKFHLLSAVIKRIAAYLVILAIDTLQITMGEKDVANTFVA